MEPFTQSHPVAPRQVTVLIVDDSKSYRYLMAAVLTTWGFSVCEAEEGLQAL